jgi:hypothetical protein
LVSKKLGESKSGAGEREEVEKKWEFSGGVTSLSLFSSFFG